MKLIILLFIFLFSSLSFSCTSQEIERSDKLYSQANQTPNLEEQIAFLEASLQSCYAPEIEASLLTVKVERSDDIYKIIDYYKTLLVVVPNFQDKEMALALQDKYNLKLSELYSTIDKEVSIIYRDKVRGVKDKKVEESQRFRYIFLFFICLISIFLICFSIKH